ncbi:MAG: helix-turn-helix domain-containing protein [Anaerolineales bacterium]
MNKKWMHLTHHSHLNINSLHAKFTNHAYPRHSHDYYVLSLIARGNQSFLHKGARYKTYEGGVIFINPDVVHTGETIDEHGFELISIYPTTANIEAILLDLTGRSQPAPYFKEAQVNSIGAAQNILFLYKTLSAGVEALKTETCFLQAFGQLLKRYTDSPFREQKIGNEKTAIQKARQYIEEHFYLQVSLKDLANHAGFSPYYFLRAFRKEVGMPPHEYLENIRIRHAQKLIEAGATLAHAAVEIGFSSQSHMTRSFKKIIGITPGQYAAQFRRK